MSTSTTNAFLGSGFFQLLLEQNAAANYLPTPSTSLAPAVAAVLLGAGSVPPRIATVTPVPVKHGAAALAKAGTLPWQLFRTGTAAASTTMPATDLDTLEKVIFAALTRSLNQEPTDQLDGPERDAKIVDDASGAGIVATVATDADHLSHRLAAQLSIVARLNQPRSRATNPQAVKAVKGRTQIEAQRLAKARASARNGTIASARIAAHGKAVIEASTRPHQAVIIDLAVAKSQRRPRAMERAA